MDSPLKTGTHSIAMEWLCGLNAFDASDPRAVQVCSSLILVGWARGEVDPRDQDTFKETSRSMQSNTTVIGNQKISNREFRVPVDVTAHLKRSNLIGGLKYDERRNIQSLHLSRTLHSAAGPASPYTPKEGIRLWSKSQ